MNIPEYADAALQSARLYYKYLTNLQQKDPFKKPHIPVRSIECGQFHGIPVCYLKLLRRPFSLDSLVFSIDFVEYPNDVKFIGWDEDTLIITARISETVRERLEQASVERVRLVSDMRFLIQRIGEWYKNTSYSHRISLPKVGSTVKPPETDVFQKTPSEEQRNALNGIFEHPLTYIWGAPGTGKTKYVLAYALMTYLKAGKPIMICAPTNNAIDQTLLGVLDILEQHEIKIDRILRLGTPGKEILRRYPQICEEHDIVKKLSECVLKIKEISEILKIKETNAPLNQAYTVLHPLSQNIQQRYLDYIQKLHEKTSIEVDLKKIRKEIENVLPVVERNAMTVKSEENKMQGVSFRLMSAISAKKKSEAEERLAAAEQIYQTSAAKLQKLNNEQKIIAAKFERLSNEFGKLTSPEQLLSEFKQQSKRYPVTANLIINLNPAMLRSLEESCDVFFKKRFQKEPESPYSDSSISDLKELLYALEEEKKTYEQAGGSIRNALIVASTADALFSRYETFVHLGVTFHHVFMDEAAYCPLIKSMIAFSFGCPVTLLGDHRQLPPVCEMNLNKLSEEHKRLAVLWHQSAVRSENIFTHSLNSLYLDYRDDADIIFETTKQYTLNHTYRFGEKIAEILAEEVYTPDFHGDRYADTSITVIHAPDSTRNGASYSEAAAIRDFILKHSIRNYAILVPYKAQLHCIKEVFPQSDDEQRIMTIHSSQGREWDTVFLSVTDTVKPFFMNSKCKESNGLQIINTAVSRARWELVIVCDYNLWICREDQLIGKIIKNADEIINSPEE